MPTREDRYARNPVKIKHNGIDYVMEGMFHTESAAEEAAKDLQIDGYTTWIEKGSTSEYYPYHLFKHK